MSRPKVGKVDWQVLDQSPAVRNIQFFGEAMTEVGRKRQLDHGSAKRTLEDYRCPSATVSKGG
jgi:hypothetical protein